MKAFMLGFCFTLISTASFACQQGPTAAYDLDKINDALKSSAFEDEIQKQYARDFGTGITKIDFQDKEVRVSLTNKCDILVEVTYWSDNGGMCPQLDKVSARTICH